MQILFGYKVNFWLVPGNVSHSTFYGRLSLIYPLPKLITFYLSRYILRKHLQVCRMTCTFAGLYDREGEPRHLTREIFSCFPRAGGILAQTKDNKQSVQCDALICSMVLSNKRLPYRWPSFLHPLHATCNENYLRYCDPLTGPHCTQTELR